MTLNPLKQQNGVAIGSVLIVDTLGLWFLLNPGLWDAKSLESSSIARAVGCLAAPVLLLALQSILSSNTKAVLVFWRLSNILPGHRAFSIYAQGDPRIDIVRLEKNVGAFPIDEVEQNKFWYRLFKKVEQEVTVAQAHKFFLLYRDLAAISVLLIGVVVMLGVFEVTNWKQTFAGATVFLIQYAISAISAGNEARRLVSSVLAVHALKKRP